MPNTPPPPVAKTLEEANATIATLWAELHAMRSELHGLRAEVAELRARQARR